MGDIVGGVAGGLLGGGDDPGAAQAAAQKQIFEKQRKALEEASELLRSGFREQVEAAKRGGFEGQFDLGEIFGAKPGVAPFSPISLTEQQAAALRGNLANLPLANQLAAGFSSGFTDAALDRVRSIVPGFDRAQAQQARTALSQLAGEIPRDVAEAVASARAELSGVAGTFGGDRNLVARDLGLTSLDLQRSGASLFQDILNQANQISPAGAQINPGSFAVSPAQQTDLSFRQNLIDQGQRQNQLNIGAAPSPAAEALFQASLANLGGQAGTLAGVAGLQPPAGPFSNAPGPFQPVYDAIGGAAGNLFDSAFGLSGGSTGGFFSNLFNSSGAGTFSSPLRALPV